MEAIFVHMSLNVSVTHLNRGLPTRLFGGIHGKIKLVSSFGAKVICFTGWSSGKLKTLANLFILLFL